LAFECPNEQAQQSGPLGKLHTSKGERAAPVCCSAWFGGVRRVAYVRDGGREFSKPKVNLNQPFN
jgi:hypothetical protein